MPSKVILIVIDVYVLGHKYVLGPFQAHFSPCLVAGAKMSLSQAQNIFMPVNINSIVKLVCFTTGNFQRQCHFGSVVHSIVESEPQDEVTTIEQEFKAEKQLPSLFWRVQELFCYI